MALALDSHLEPDRGDVLEIEEDEIGTACDPLDEHVVIAGLQRQFGATQQFGHVL